MNKIVLQVKRNVIVDLDGISQAFTIHRIDSSKLQRGILIVIVSDKSFTSSQMSRLKKFGYEPFPDEDGELYSKWSKQIK